MTAVVGIAEGGHVWVGADSAVSWMDDAARLSLQSNPKVFRVGQFLIGYCGSGRVGRLLQYSLQPPKYTRKSGSVDKYISTAFIDAVRKCLTDGGVNAKEFNVEGVPSDFLVGYNGRLWRVDGDFNVDEAAQSYDAVGCGSVVALGAMYATQGQPPVKRIRTALKAAQEFSYGVRGPFKIETL